jgi:hypothetical protein
MISSYSPCFVCAWISFKKWHGCCPLLSVLHKLFLLFWISCWHWKEKITLSLCRNTCRIQFPSLKHRTSANALNSSTVTGLVHQDDETIKQPVLFKKMCVVCIFLIGVFLHKVNKMDTYWGHLSICLHASYLKLLSGCHCSFELSAITERFWVNFILVCISPI